MADEFWKLTPAERRQVYGQFSPALKRRAVERAKEKGIEVDFLDSAPAGLPDRGSTADALDAAAASGNAPVPAGVPRVGASVESAMDSEVYDQFVGNARSRALQAGTRKIAETDNVARVLDAKGNVREDAPQSWLNRGKQLYRGMSEGVGGVAGMARWAAQGGPFGEESFFDLIGKGADDYGKESSGATPGAQAAEEASLRAWMEAVAPLNEFERRAAEGRRPTGREILYHRGKDGRLVGERDNVENAALRMMGSMGIPLVGTPSRGGRFIADLGKKGGVGLWLATRGAAGAYNRGAPALAVYMGANYADDPEFGAAIGGLTAAGASLIGDVFFGKGASLGKAGKSKLEKYLSGTPEVQRRDLTNVQSVVNEGGDIAEMIGDAPQTGVVRGGVGRRIGNYAAYEQPKKAMELANRNEEFRNATLGRLRQMVEDGTASAAQVVDHIPAAEADAAWKMAAPLRGHSTASARWAREHLPKTPPHKEIEFDMKKSAGEVWDDFQSWFTMKADLPEPSAGADDLARRERAAGNAANFEEEIKVQGAKVKALDDAEETAKAAMDNTESAVGRDTEAFQAAADKYDKANKAAEAARDEHARLAMNAEAAEFDAGNGLWSPARLIDLRRAASAAQRAAVDSRSQTAPAKAKFYNEFIAKIDKTLEEHAPEYAKQMEKFRGKWAEHLRVHNPVRDLRNPRRATDKKAWRDDIILTMRTPARVKKWLVAAGGGDTAAGAEAAWGTARDMMTDDEFIRIARDLHGSEYRDPALKRLYALAREDAVEAMMRRGGDAPLTEFKTAEQRRALGRIYEGVKDTPAGGFLKHAALRQWVLEPGEAGKNVAKAVGKLMDNRGTKGMFTPAEQRALLTLAGVWENMRQMDLGLAQGVSKSVNPDKVGKVIDQVQSKLWQMNILVSAKTAAFHSWGKLFRANMREKGAEKLLESLMVSVADADPDAIDAIRRVQDGTDKKGIKLARVLMKSVSSAVIAARNMAQVATPAARAAGDFGEERLGGYDEDEIDEILRMSNRGRPAGEARAQ